VAVLATVPFLGSLAGGFVYDDHVLIEQRNAVHSLAELGELWRGEFWQGLPVVHFRYLRPLVSTSYAIDWAIWSGHPFGFHLTNLVLHASVSLLFYAALCRWTAAPWGALAATLAWAWHPSKVEAVSWIAGRTDLLCALGILVLCGGVKRRLAGSVVTGIALEVLGFAIALSSKEHAVVAPAFVAVEAWAHFGRRPLDGPEFLRAARHALVHAAVALGYVAFRAFHFPIVPERVGTMSFIDARLYTIETLGEFARIVFFPLSLSIQRAPIRIDAAHRVLHDPVRLALGLAFIALLAVVLVIWRRRNSSFRMAGCLLGLAALVPVANIVAPRMVFLFAERFSYLPLMGFAMCLVRARAKRSWATPLGGLVLPT